MTESIEFRRAAVAGNQYLIHVLEQGRSEPDIRRIIDTAKKLGEAGGLIVVFPASDLEASVWEIWSEEKIEWTMRFFELPSGNERLSASALKAFVRFCVETGLTTVTDRRQTIPIFTGGTVFDSLIGVSGVSVDCGGWRLMGESPVSLAAGGEAAGQTDLLEIRTVFGRTRSALLPGGMELELPESNGAGFVSVEFERVKDGVGYARAATLSPEGAEVSYSGSGAIVAALTARHCSGDNLPHHWRISQPGGEVAVRMFPTEEGEHISISGDVVISA